MAEPHRGSPSPTHDPPGRDLDSSPSSTTSTLAPHSSSISTLSPRLRKKLQKFSAAQTTASSEGSPARAVVHEAPAAATVFGEIHRFVRTTLEPQWGSEDVFDTGEGEEEGEGGRRSVLAQPSAFARLRSFVRASLRVAADPEQDFIGTPPEWDYHPSQEFAVSDHRLTSDDTGASPTGKDHQGNQKGRLKLHSHRPKAAHKYGKLHSQRHKHPIRSPSSVLLLSEVRPLPCTSEVWQTSSDAGQALERLSPVSSPSVESAPGLHRLETVPDTSSSDGDLDLGPHLATACVGRYANLEDQLIALQQRYGKVLEAMQLHALTGADGGVGTASLLPPEFAPPPIQDADGPTPGTDTLLFAKNCLDELNTALLTGPFSYLPELEQPADLLQGALRQLLSTAAALHHELELRSIAHSRHKLEQLAFRRQLQLDWHEAVSTAEADVRRARQKVMDLLSHQIERNMALLQQLTAYADQAERISDGRGRLQATYARLLQLDEMKRKEVLMVRTLLLNTSQSKGELRKKVLTMRDSIAQLIRVETAQSLFEEGYVEHTESDIVMMQDIVTQTKQTSEDMKREVKRKMLRKNKAVQIQRRLETKCEEMVVEVKRIYVLTKEAAEGTDERYRTLGTLTSYCRVLHEHTQTENIRVRNALQALNDEVLKQLEAEGKQVEVDLTPFLRELHTLQEECRASTEKATKSRRLLHKLQRQKQVMTQQRDLLRRQVSKTRTSASNARAELGHIDGDHEAVMTLLKEQLEMATAALKTSQEIWTELQNVHGAVLDDLDAVQHRHEQLQQQLQDRRDQTSDLLARAKEETEEGLLVREELEENLWEEEEIRQHLEEVVAQIKDGTQPALTKLKDALAAVRAQNGQLEALRDQQTGLLAASSDRTAELGRQAAELQLRVDEMRIRRRDLQIEITGLKERRTHQLMELAERRHLLECTRASYDQLSQQLRDEQWQQERLVAMLRGWCRQVELCNGGYIIEIARMERELKTFYGDLDRSVAEELALDQRKMAQLQQELLDLNALLAKKNADYMERDWQLRAALLACSEAAKRSLLPVTKAMSGLDAERRKLTRMVEAAVKMRPFGKVQVDVVMPSCPLPLVDEQQ